MAQYDTQSLTQAVIGRLGECKDARFKQVMTSLVQHLHEVAPWGAHVTVQVEATGAPFEAATGGAAYRTMAAAMQEAYGQPMAHLGQGGSIPLCNVLQETYPEAEIILMGVEEPQCLIHAPNESVDPGEIEAMALAEALFLQRYADA